MKNTKIVKAWDSVNPTPAQKRRMRAALEARLGKEKAEDRLPPEREARREQPRYQSARPAKSRGSAFAVIAALLAVVVAGGLFLGMMRGSMEETPSYAAPVETAPTTHATEAVQAPQLPEAYQERIDTYITAIQEGWNIEKCANADISLATPNVQKLDDLGFCLMDLDGDGSEELLITDGNVIYSMCSLSPEGEAVTWITGMERTSYYLCADNLIAEIGSGSAATTYYTFYHFSNITLDKIQAVTFNADKDRENPWFLGDNEQPITEAEANQVLNMYYHLYIPHTTLSGEAPLPEGAVPDETVLNLYAQEISGILEAYTKAENMTFCFYDYDGDGETECLLGAGEALYAVLRPEAPSDGATDISDGVTDIQTVFATGSEYYAYLCENGIMEDTGYGQGYLYHAFYKVQGNEKLDHVLYDYESWYTKADGEDLVPVSEEEAKAVLGKYKRLNMPWKDIAQFPAAIPQLGGTQISTLFDEVYLPIAAEGKPVTEDSLKSMLEERGLSWTVRDALINCSDPEIPGSGLGIPLSGEEFLGNPITYSLEGEVGRFVEAHLEESGVSYRKGTTTYHNSYPASSVEELVEFLTMDEENILALKTAETYAEKYFASAAADMRREQTKAATTSSIPGTYNMIF